MSIYGQEYAATRTEAAKVRALQSQGVCPKCVKPMQPGQCLKNDALTGVGDFSDEDRVMTVSARSSGRLYDCLKCHGCGLSAELGEQ